MLATNDMRRFNGSPMGKPRKKPINPVEIAVRKIGTGDVGSVAELIGISRAALHTYMKKGYLTPQTATARGTQYWTVKRLAEFSGFPDWMLLGFRSEPEYEAAMKDVHPELRKALGLNDRT